MRRALLLRFAATQTDVRRVLIAALSVGIIGLIGAILAAAVLSDRNAVHAGWVRHTFQVELAIQNFRVPMWQAEAARRGYIITPNSGALGVYQDASAELEPALDALESLTRDNPNQGRRIAQLRALTARIMQMRAESMAAVQHNRVDMAARQRWVDDSVPLLLTIRTIGAELRAAEQRLLDQREAKQAASLRTFYVILAVAGVLVVAVAMLTLFTVLRYTNDLTRSRDQLRDLADSLEDSVRERTADLTRANDEIQRFAYIVSHDLRSPLVNVLGFTAELETAAATLDRFIDSVEHEAPDMLTADARTAAHDDLPEAIGFIRSSTQKMDRLINAILKLAREGKRAIAPEPLDLNQMVGEITDSLQHRLDTLGATIVVPAPLPALISDRMAVEQILSNIIENAVKYLQPGCPGHISVTGARADGHVTIAIADNGRGIDPRDHERVFDLFRRSGVQDQPGEGIGLAHVRALAYRLGGRIDVESVLGGGATFRLMLPISILNPREA